MSEFSVDDLFGEKESLQDFVKKTAVGKNSGPKYKDTLADTSAPRTPMNPRTEAAAAGERFRGIKGSLPIPEGKYDPVTDSAHGSTSISSDLSHFSKLHEAIAQVEHHANIHEERIRVQSEGNRDREMRGQATLNPVWEALGNASASVDKAVQAHIRGEAGSSDSSTGSVGHINDVLMHLRDAHRNLKSVTSHLGPRGGAYTNESTTAIKDAADVRNNYITRNADAINASTLQGKELKGTTEYSGTGNRRARRAPLNLPLQSKPEMEASRAATAERRANQAPGFAEAKADIAPQPAVRPAPKVQNVPAFNERVARYSEANSKLAAERQETTKAAMDARVASRSTWRQGDVQAGPATGMKANLTVGSPDTVAEQSRSRTFQAQQATARQASANKDASVAALEELRTRRSAEIESKQSNEIREIAAGGDHLRAATLHWMNTTGRQGRTFAAPGKGFSKTGAAKYDKEVRRDPTAYLQKQGIVPGGAPRKENERSRTGTFRSTPKFAAKVAPSEAIEKLATSVGTGNYRSGASSYTSPNETGAYNGGAREYTGTVNTEKPATMGQNKRNQSFGEGAGR